jgi:hypothetical protein
LSVNVLAHGDALAAEDGRSKCGWRSANASDLQERVCCELFRFKEAVPQQVVPANAGTHTLCPIVLNDGVEVLRDTNARGYGSLRSGGRLGER